MAMGDMRALSMVLAEPSQSSRKGRHTTATVSPKLAPGISVLPELRQSIKTLPAFSHLLSDFSHASKLDARHETYRARLDTDSRTVKGGRARGINA